jgi:hypothetical protein
MKIKISKLLPKIKTAIGISKLIVTGKQSKIIDRLDKGEQIAEKALEIFNLLKQ